MNTLIIIMAHAGIQRTFDRHLPYWRHHGYDLLVTCPVTAMIQTSHQVLGLGANTHHGADVNRKVKDIFKFIERTRYDRFVFHEYDSLCFTPELPFLDEEKLYGNMFLSDQKEFKGTRFFHPPITMTHAVLEGLNQVLSGIPDDAERGFWDRLLGLAVDLGHLPNDGYGELGFARNTIEPEHVPAAIEARLNGAVMYHGVKTEAVLNALLTA